MAQFHVWLLLFTLYFWYKKAKVWFLSKTIKEFTGGILYGKEKR